MIAGRDEDGDVMQCLSCGYAEPRQQRGNRPMAAAYLPAEWSDLARARLAGCLRDGQRSEAHAITMALAAYEKALAPRATTRPMLPCRRCRVELPVGGDPRATALRGRCEDEAACAARRQQQGRVA